MAHPLTLPRRLDNAAATDLRSMLLAHRGTALALDAAQLTMLGTLCLQVLMSARLLWAKDRVALRVDNLSADLVARLAVLGVTPADLSTEAG